MAEELLVFGFFPSPFSFIVKLALKLKGIHYEYIEEDVVNKKSDLLLKYNPVYMKVPVLVHNGKPISESFVILEYIEETWTENYAILPQDPHQRALARFWANFIVGTVLYAVMRACKRKGDERDKAVEEAKKAFETLEEEVKSNKLFGGETIGFVDIVGTIVAYWFPTIEEALGIELITSHEFPNLRQWSQQLVNHSVVKELLPKKDELVAYLKTTFR